MSTTMSSSEYGSVTADLISYIATGEFFGHEWCYKHMLLSQARSQLAAATPAATQRLTGLPWPTDSRSTALSTAASCAHAPVAEILTPQQGLRCGEGGIVAGATVGLSASKQAHHDACTDSPPPGKRRCAEHPVA